MKLNYGISALLLLSSMAIFFTNQHLLIDSIYFSLLPILIAATILLRSDNFSLINIFKKSSYKQSIFSLILATIFIIMLNPVAIFKSGIFKNRLIISIYGQTVSYIISTCYRILLIPVVFFSAFICIYSAFQFKINDVNTSKSEKIHLKFKFYPQTIVISMVSFVFMISSFPVLSFSDATGCWNLAISNTWDDWHTVGFIFFIKLCSLIVKSPFSVIVVQTLFWILINNYAIHILFQHSHSKFVCNLYVLLSCVFFTPYVYLQLMYKDVVYNMFLFAFSIAVLDFIYKDKLHFYSCIPCIVFGTLASLFRHAGDIPVIITSIVVLIISLVNQRDKILQSFSILISPVIAYILIVNIFAMNILHAVPNPRYVSYTIPMLTVGAVVASGVPLSADEEKIIEQVTTVEKLKSCYNKYFADPIARSWSTIGNDIENLNNPKISNSILKLNARFLVEHPRIYIRSLLNISSIVWEIARPADGYEWAPINGAAIDYDSAFKTVQPNAATSITKPLTYFTNQTPVLRTVFWRGGFWIFILLLSLALLQYKKQYKASVGILPILIYCALLFISIPAQDPRYILGTIEFAIFYFIFAISKKPDANTN